MYKNKQVFAVIVAAGKGSRIGFDKMLYNIGGQAVVEKSISAFANNEYIDKIIVVASGDNFEKIQEILRAFKQDIALLKGGNTRAQSVANAINALPQKGLVAIHDGARPFVCNQIINETISAAFECGAAVPCVKVKDTIKQSEGQFVTQSLDRKSLFITQTPQIFDMEKYREYAKIYFDSEITDDAQIFEKAGAMVKITQGEYKNYKITTTEDLKGDKKMRIGHGYDVHKLVENRKLIIGGVNIPYDKGLLGHSDADVLLHAISDSLLGALALGDIGKHFPDSDEKYKNADSTFLLKQVFQLVKNKGATIGNIDATILCQAPKLSPYIESMRENISRCLEIDIGKISIKATTEEGLGFTGKQEGIAAHCVCLLEV